MNYLYSQTFDELIESSDLIAIVETKQNYDEREQKITYHENDPTHEIKSRWTVTELEVKKIVKSNDSLLKKGDTVNVNETFFVDGNNIYPDGEYVPIKKNEKYLVFLGIHPKTGAYYVLDLNNGRYQLTGKEHVERHGFELFEEKALKKYEKAIKESLKEN